MGWGSLFGVLLLSGPAGETMVVMPTQFDSSAAGLVPTQIFDDALLAAAQEQSGQRVIGRDDLSAVLGFERQRDLLGCDEVTCMAEIAGMLDAEHLMVVRVGLLGEEWMVSAKLIKVRGEPVVIARKTRMVRGDQKDLVRAVPDLIAELYDRPTPVRPPAVPHLTQADTDQLRPVSDPLAFEPFRNYVARSDWDRYARDAGSSGRPAALANWVFAQNQESSALAVAELVSCLAFFGGIGSLAEGRGPGEALTTAGGLGCLILPIVDLFDLGSVRQYSPPPSLATVAPPPSPGAGEPWGQPSAGRFRRR